MNILAVPIPENSSIHFAKVYPLEERSLRGIVLDFNSLVYANGDSLVDLDAFTIHRQVILKCDFPSACLLDIFFYISYFSNFRNVYLATSRISSAGLSLCKKMGLAGLVGDQPNLNTSMLIGTIIDHVPCDETIRKIEGLSSTEIAVLYYISLGLTNNQISDLVCRSYHTIKNHKINIVRKIGAAHCHELSQFCQKLKFSFL